MDVAQKKQEVLEDIARAPESVVFARIDICDLVQLSDLLKTEFIPKLREAANTSHSNTDSLHEVCINLAHQRALLQGAAAATNPATGILAFNINDGTAATRADGTAGHNSSGSLSFPTLEDAVQTAQQVIQYGIPIARIEMLNKDQMGISINYSKLTDIEAVPTLFFEFHGSESSNNENIKIVEEISKDNKGSSFKWAKDLEERNKLWRARWDVYYSVKALINNGRVYSTDVCVPISKITECVNFAEEQAKKFGVRAPMVGHLGDGNFHVVLPFDPAKKEMYKQIRAFNDSLIKKALELNGTITGEHGVGLHKKEYLLDEHPDNIPVMKSIKRTIDPNNIMNPGKIFDLN